MNYRGSLSIIYLLGRLDDGGEERFEDPGQEQKLHGSQTGE